MLSLIKFNKCNFNYNIIFSKKFCRNMHLNYEASVDMLNSLQSNAATLQKLRIYKDEMRKSSIPEMIRMTSRAGISLFDLDKLSIIHVSGTKGKGSTCAFTESILRHHGFKTGFYSSPHLVEVRERIRINGEPLSKSKFSEYFWKVYSPIYNSREYETDLPPYFRFLTIMAFYTFMQEEVDVAVIEVGIGGEFDCTNIIRQPVVCGVTSLGLDHVNILGDTIEKIAWAKSGIFKSEIPAITVMQVDEALRVLLKRSKIVNAPLYIAPYIEEYVSNEKINLGIKGSMQHVNSSLALQLCHFWLNRKTNASYTLLNNMENNYLSIPFAQAFPLSKTFLKSLSEVKWPGRCQLIEDGKITWCLDGAHTAESIQVCTQWYNQILANNNCNSKRILIFNSTGERDMYDIIKQLQTINFDVIIFCPNILKKLLDKQNHDLLNRMITEDTQIKRCHSNREMWIKYLSCILKNNESATIFNDKIIGESNLTRTDGNVSNNRTLNDSNLNNAHFNVNNTLYLSSNFSTDKNEQKGLNFSHDVNNKVPALILDNIYSVIAWIKKLADTLFDINEFIRATEKEFNIDVYLIDNHVQATNFIIRDKNNVNKIYLKDQSICSDSINLKSNLPNSDNKVMNSYNFIQNKKNTNNIINDESIATYNNFNEKCVNEFNNVSKLSVKEQNMISNAATYNVISNEQYNILNESSEAKTISNFSNLISTNPQLQAELEPNNNNENNIQNLQGDATNYTSTKNKEYELNITDNSKNIGSKVFNTVSNGQKKIENSSGRIFVLCTGSLHLVGGVLSLLQQNKS